MIGQLDLFSPAPAPTPAPIAVLSTRGAWETVTIASSADLASIEASSSCSSLCDSGKVLRPFHYRGADWVCTGSSHYRGASEFECFRVVSPAAFVGPNDPQPYGVHDFHNDEVRPLFGAYHGMLAKLARRDVVLEGPPIVFLAHAGLSA